MKILTLLLAVAFGIPATTCAQSMSAAASGGSSVAGRSCGSGGGSSFLKLNAVNRFPEGQLIGFAYGIVNKEELAYLVCFENSDVETEIDESVLKMNVAVKDKNGKITQVGTSNEKLITIKYSAKVDFEKKTRVENIEIDGTDLDFAKGRIFVISEIDDRTLVDQYNIELSGSSQIDTMLKLVQRIKGTSIGRQ